METIRADYGRVRLADRLGWLFFVLGCGGPLVEATGQAQPRDSLAGEATAQAMKESLLREAEQYRLRYGPVRFRTRAGVQVGYTDNVFYSEADRRDDVVISPNLNLGAFMQVSELNTLRLALDLGYEYYVKNNSLNSDFPLVNPNSELAFNLFVGDFRIRFHERFAYQESLFYNTIPSRQDLLYNFSDVARLARWENNAGLKADWDLDRLTFTAGYEHVNFASTTESFEYLNRASERFAASGSFRLGDQAQTGVESVASLNDFETETVMDDNWRLGVGPFFEVNPLEKISLRAGVGYDAAWYGSGAEDSEYHTYYAYGRLRQETRLFAHALSVGREHLLGDNANNLATTYVRYSIDSPVFEHVEVGANAAVHFAEEFGGGFSDHFTYYVVGVRIGYQVHKYWRADLGYEFMLRDSDTSTRDFHRNRVTLGASFTF